MVAKNSKYESLAFLAVFCSVTATFLDAGSCAFFFVVPNTSSIC